MEEASAMGMNEVEGCCKEGPKLIILGSKFVNWWASKGFAEERASEGEASRIAIARARADMRWLQRADKEKPKWCSRSKYCTQGGCNCNSVLRLRLY